MYGRLTHTGHVYTAYECVESGYIGSVTESVPTMAYVTVPAKSAHSKGHGRTVATAPLGGRAVVDGLSSV